jgi:hypothetical protein
LQNKGFLERGRKLDEGPLGLEILLQSGVKNKIRFARLLCGEPFAANNTLFAERSERFSRAL